ncbi:thioredoxin domain-containing protein [Sphingomonas sp.]|jgi:protein-disulfide isomerase|uniref:thioredoxin domain-containing protein n=1 Tax=Sphingomonas sp. TaxID=28214 RepID=UPI0035C79F87
MKYLVALAAALALSACGDPGDGNITAPANSVAAVAAPAGQDWTQVVKKTPEGGYLMGNPNASLKLVEYGSRTCPTCGAFGQTGMQPLEANYVKSGKVSYEFRDFLVHAPDLGVALVGHCAGTEPYFPILEQMFAEQPAVLEKLGAAGQFQQSIINRTPQQQAAAWADHLGYIDFAKQRGIPESQLKACLADEKLIADIVKISDSAMKQGITGTPTFLLNGRKLDGQVTWDQIEQTLKNAGA